MMLGVGDDDYSFGLDLLSGEILVNGKTSKVFLGKEPLYPKRGNPAIFNRH